MPYFPPRPAPEKSVFHDPNDIKWTWIGEGKQSEDNDKIYYDAAEVVRISDGTTRQFKVGDAVYVPNVLGEERGEGPWVAHLVEFFEICAADFDVTIGTDPWKNMRCTLRWIYNLVDLDKESFSINPDVPAIVPGELYFTDHVEGTGSNRLEVIEGRAFLCATPTDMRYFLDNPPEDYWKLDVIRLVRCFYGLPNGGTPPIRRLERGELKFLLDHPSTDRNLYGTSNSDPQGVTGNHNDQGRGAN